MTTWSWATIRSTRPGVPRSELLCDGFRGARNTLICCAVMVASAPFTVTPPSRKIFRSASLYVRCAEVMVTGSRFSVFVDLHEQRGDWLAGRAFRDQRTLLAVKFNRRSLHHVRILPQGCMAAIHGDPGRPVRSHAAAGHVDRIGRGKHSPVGLRLQFGVRTLNVALGDGVTCFAIHAHDLGRCGHATVHHARRSVQNQHLIGWAIGRALSPRL